MYRLVALLILLGWSHPLVAQTQKIQISWDQELAFERDRESYQKMLMGIAIRAASTVSSELGILLDKPLELTVYTRPGYMGKFRMASGAHYFRGKIHVNGGTRLNDRFAGLLEHEISHAYVDHKKTARYLPTWLNEGLAERFRWRRMGMRKPAPNQVNELKQACEKDRLVPLPVRARLSPFGYLQSWAAVLFIEHKYGQRKLKKLVHVTVEQKSFPRALKQVLKDDIEDLEREFAEWVSELD